MTDERYTDNIMNDDHENALSNLSKTAPLTSYKRRGKIITVYSPQGGAGTTTLAVNLACGLLRDDVRVLLVDTDMQFGDVDVLLYMPTGRTLAEVTGSANNLDTDFLHDVVATHTSGLRVMMGAGGMTDALTLRSEPDSIVKTLERLTDEYDYIVVDTSSVLDALTKRLFEVSDRLLLVSRPTLPSVKHIRNVLDVLDKFESAHGKIELILNAVPFGDRHSRVSLDAKNIAKVLKQPIAAYIPYDAETLHAATIKGLPLIAFDPQRQATITQRITRLAELLHDDFTNEKRGWPSG